MALKTQQSRILVETGGSPTLTEIEEVNNIIGPDGKAKLIDATHLRSLGKEYLRGIADFGQISLDMNFASSAPGQVFLRDMYITQLGPTADPKKFRIMVPDGASFHVFDFLGICTSWSLDVKTDDKVGLKATLQVTGSVAYTPPGESPM
jgi:hypothetical protein